MKLAYEPENGDLEEVPQKVRHAQRPGRTAWNHGQDPGLLLAHHTRSTHTAHHMHPTAPCARVGQAAGEQADRSWQPPGSPRAQPFTFLTLFPHMLKHRLKNPKPQQMITKWFPAMGVPTPPIRNRVKTWPGRKLKLRVPSAPRAAHPGCSS